MTPSELNCSLPMDTPKPPQKPHHLLDDLESIREFLSHKEPTGPGVTDDFADLPLLTDSVEMGQIPLLSDIVAPGPTAPAHVTAQPPLHSAPPPPPEPQPRPSIPAAPAHVPPPAVARPDPSPAALTPPPPSASAPAPASTAQAAQRSVMTSNTTSDLLRLDAELRAAAQLILQDVIDDFVPQIEAELKRRLEARLTRLLPPRKG